MVVEVHDDVLLPPRRVIAVFDLAEKARLDVLPANMSLQVVLGVEERATKIARNVLFGTMAGFEMLFKRCLCVELLPAAVLQAFKSSWAVTRQVLRVRISDDELDATNLAGNLFPMLPDMQVVLAFVEYHDFAEPAHESTREVDTFLVVLQSGRRVELSPALLALVLAVLLVVQRPLVMRSRPLVQERFGTIRTFESRGVFSVSFHVNFDVAFVEALEAALVALERSVVDLVLVGLDLYVKTMNLRPSYQQ